MLYNENPRQDAWGTKAIDDARTFKHAHVVAYLEPLIAMVGLEIRSRGRSMRDAV